LLWRASIFSKYVVFAHVAVNEKRSTEGRKIEPESERKADFYLDQNGSMRYILPSFSREKY
jgi:hypothetical protein